MKTILAGLGLLAIAALSGCGIQRQTVRVDAPSVHANPVNGPQVVVAPVKDERTDASVLQFPASDRAKNVGGVLHGGNGIQVNLESATAAQKMHAIIVQALRGMGYETTDHCGHQCTTIDVVLTGFAVQMPFNFWRAATYSRHMVADVSANVSVQGNSGTRQFKATGHGSNVFQRAVAENWQIAINRAVADFSRDFQSQMAHSQ